MSQHNKNKNKNNTAKQQQSCIYMLQQHNKMKTSLVSTEARHNIHIVYAAASCSEQQSTQTTTIAATKYAQSRNGNMPNMRSCLRCQTYHIEAANKASQPATAFPPPC